MAQKQQLTPAQQTALDNQKIVQANMAARQMVLQQSYPMLQSVQTGTIDPRTNPVLNITPQNVGLIGGFLIKLTATFVNTGTTGAVALTPFGPANLLSNITFTDLQNYQRINTTGWHLNVVNTATQQRPFFSSTPSDSPVGYGSNFKVIDAPATMAFATTSTVDMYYWVPLAYSANDLSGAIYANVVNATMNLQVTFNNAPVVAAGADPTNAVYIGANSTNSAMTSITYNVYQSYLDQLPMTSSGPLLPAMDLNTMYSLQNTTFANVSAGSDTYIPYSNFRHFLSTTCIYDNNGVLNAGTDINYWALRTANMTDTRKADPYTWAGFTRRRIQSDMPVGTYYFDTRNKPIFTTQTGNTNLIMNPLTATATSKILVGWESLATISTLINAGSLGSN